MGTLVLFLEFTQQFYNSVRSFVSNRESKHEGNVKKNVSPLTAMRMWRQCFMPRYIKVGYPNLYLYFVN